MNEHATNNNFDVNGVNTAGAGSPDTELCYHCGLPADAEVFTEKISGTLFDFCCNGCMQICKYIYASGMADYYDKRDLSRPGAVPGALPDALINNDNNKFLIDETGDFITDKGEYKQASLSVGGIHCAACIWLIETVLGKTPGVKSARVNFSSNRLTLEWDSSRLTLSEVARKLAGIGYRAVPFNDVAAEAALVQRKNSLLVKIMVAGVATAGTLFMADGLYAGYFWGIEETYRGFMQWASLVIALPAVLFSSSTFVRGAVNGLKVRALTMDLPVALGALITVFYSSWATVAGRGDVYFDSACMFVFLILIGRYLETMARKKAADSTSALTLSDSDTATIIKNGKRVVVHARTIQLGDILEVVPGDRIAVDCEIIEGATTVDESMLTGESSPVEKAIGDKVFGSTINMDGSVRMRVTSVGDATVYAGIKRLVEDAQMSKARIQQTADRIATYFVPTILIVAALTFAYWYFATSSLSNAVIYCVAVLIITCPCALALATPTAILAGCGAAAKRGILIKSAVALENACKATVVVLDKTGTLTKGKMSVESVFVDSTDNNAYSGIEKKKILAIAATVEARSEHPVAKAIVREARKSGQKQINGLINFTAMPGKGVIGEFDEIPDFLAAGGDKHDRQRRVVEINKDNTKFRVYIGNEKMMTENGAVISEALYEARRVKNLEGKSSVYVALQSCSSHGRILAAGIITTSDPVRVESEQLISELHDMGLKTILLSGDTSGTANAVGTKLQIGRVISEVLPKDKEEIIRGLQRDGERVIMVGDGINDGPALAASDVGMAVGSGTQLAIESADIVLLNSNALMVARAIRISKHVFGGIKQNLGISAAYNALLTPLAAMGFIVPVLAAIVMPLSSLIVIGNSIRAARAGLKAGNE